MLGPVAEGELQYIFIQILKIHFFPFSDSQWNFLFPKIKSSLFSTGDYD